MLVKHYLVWRAEHVHTNKSRHRPWGTRVLAAFDHSKKLKKLITVISLTVINWRMVFSIVFNQVFLVEYAGPLIVYMLLYIRPAIVYGPEAASKPYASVVQWVLCIGLKGYSEFHSFWSLFEIPRVHYKFDIFITVCSCQANCELWNEVVNFTLKSIGKLWSWLEAKFAHSLWLVW